MSDRLLQRPDGAGRPALLEEQHQGLLWGRLWLLWLHVLQPRAGVQLRRVSVLFWFIMLRRECMKPLCVCI